MDLNCWINENWPWLALLMGAVILLSQVTRALSEIHATWGSVWKWFTRRKAITEEKQRAMKAQTQAIEKLLTTTAKTAKDVNEVRKKVDELEESNQILLRLQLKDRTEAILDRGYQYYDELDEINDLFERYNDGRRKDDGIKSRVERTRRIKTVPRYERKEREENERAKY